MFRYFAYYNCGGYKDLYLGSTESDDEFVYYSSLLQSWKNGVENFVGGKKTIDQLKEIDKLPQIEMIDNTSEVKLPQYLSMIETQGGYNMICGRIGEKNYALTIRDIPSCDTDEFGESINFTFHIVGDSINEIDRIAEYARINFKSEIRKITPLFSYNAKLNCLQFNLKEMNAIVKEALAKTQNIAVNNIELPIHQIVIQNGFPLSEIAHKIGISGKNIYIAYDEYGNVINKSQSESVEIYDDIKKESGNLLDNDTRETKTVDDILNIAKKMLCNMKMTEEDEQDFEEIKRRLKNILNRRKKQ